MSCQAGHSLARVLLQFKRWEVAGPAALGCTQAREHWNLTLFQQNKPSTGSMVKLLSREEKKSK